MSKILDWIKKHVWQTVLIGFGLFFLPLILVHIAYRIPAISPWFASIWSPGELITYIAGFEAFLGTVALGSVAARQNDKANLINSKLLMLERRRSIFERKPDVFLSEIMVQTQTFSELLSQNKKFYTHNGFPGKTIDDLNIVATTYHLFSFFLVNNSNFRIEAELKELTITDLAKDKCFDYFNVPFANGGDVIEISPGSSKEFLFEMDNFTLLPNSFYDAHFTIYLMNVADDHYHITADFIIYPIHCSGEHSLSAEVSCFNYKLIPLDE